MSIDEHGGNIDKIARQLKIEPESLIDFSANINPLGMPTAFKLLLAQATPTATYSISGAVVGEWIGAQEGLGYYPLRVKNGYMLDRVFACVLIIIILSLCMNGLIRIYQHFALPYLKNDAN